MDARVLYVMVQLLDHQMVDTDGYLAGKVDDAEISVGSDGSGTLDAFLSGPGVLANRLRHRVYGRWREELERSLEPTGDSITRIPISLTRELGVTVTLNVRRDQLASMGSERWVRDHIISHVPGSRHQPDDEQDQDGS